MMPEEKERNLTEFPQIHEDEEGLQNGHQPGFLGGLLGRLFRPENANPPNSFQELAIDPEEDEVPDLQQSPQSNEVATEGDNVSVTSENSKKKSRFTAFFKSSKENLGDYNRSDFKRYWMPDSTVKECYECHEKFTSFKRKHHCRLCGQIFCSKCTKNSINGAALGYAGLLRVCGYCEKNVDSYLSSSSSKPRRADTSTSNTSGDQLVSGNTGVATVSNGPILYSNGSSLLYRGESSQMQIHQSLSAAEVKSSSDTLNPAGTDPSHLSVQELQDYQRFIHENGVRNEELSLRIDDKSNEPEWVRNIASGKRQNVDDFKPIECPAYEIQPCITDETSNTSNVRTSRASTDRTVAPELKEGSDLNDLFEAKLEQMMDYLFIREQLDKNKWHSVIWPLSKEVASMVKVDMFQRGTEESMNILKYVHVKKLLVNEPDPEYEVISGVVCTKTLAHTDMPKHIDNASVMVLSGGLEYEREPQKLTSIDPIIEQENEFLEKHVDRITCRRVSLLLVEDSVAKVASDMLMRAQVSVVTNTKRSVLERVARSTKATLTSLMDAQMHPGVVGFCPQFKERLIKLKTGELKSVLVFDDCSAEVGVSILLRSDSRRDLKAAKKILKLMILMRYSSALEVAFLKMFETTPAIAPPTCQVCVGNIGEKFDQPNDFLIQLSKSELTNSPLVFFPPPFLETPIGRECYLLDYFKKPTYHFFQQSDFEFRKETEDKLQDKLDELSSELSKEKDKIDTFKCLLMKKTDVVGVDQANVAKFRAKSGLLFEAKRRKKQQVADKIMVKAESLKENYRDTQLNAIGPNYDALNPYSHQRIAFLYSSFPKKQGSNLCSGPWLVVWRFYEAQDRTLGTFLTNFCLNEGYKCKNCNKSMMDHQRKFVHRYARIEITTEILVKPAITGEDGQPMELPPSFAADANGILAWRRCPSCRLNSNVVQISNAVWHMSFAKFIDYLANGIYCKSPLFGINSECSHCTFHEQQHYFSRKNYTTCFKVIPIKPLHVTFAPILCSVEPLLIKCQSIIFKRLETLSLADTIFTEARAFLETHDSLLKTTDAYQHVSSFLEAKKRHFDETMNSFVISPKFEVNDTVFSNDRDYLLAMDAFARCRKYLFNFVQEWNAAKTANDLLLLSKKNVARHVTSTASSANLLEPQSQTIEELVFRTSAENGNGIRATHSDSNLYLKELKELAATQIGIPVPKNYHWDLEFNDEGVPVIVKDMLDHKGNTHPDIGSIIAFALSKKDYQEKRRKMRDSLSEQGEPLTLRNKNIEGVSGVHSTPKDANANIEIEFEDNKAHYYVKVYFAEHFDLLRKTIFTDGEDQFIRSLSTSGSWHPEGGKSGASFFRTQDERFIFKQLSTVELDCFRKCAPKYFDYIYTAVTEKKLTALGKIYGVYQVAYRNKQDNQEFKMDVLVMEFLFYRKQVKKLWDLKGSLRNRYASPKSAAPVLLDENLVQDLWGNQIYIFPHSKAALNQAMANDSHFLTSLDIMDYSLLAGICEDTGEVVVGVVDYMRTFTLDKKLESLVKTALPTPHSPTVVSPAAYCRRFCEAIDVYFPFAPDQWTELNAEK